MDIYEEEPDFEAEITILREDQGGRKTPPDNYIRWDFCYAEDNPLESEQNLSAPLYMIHPNFLDDEKKPISKGIPLHGTKRANMHIVVRKMVKHHQDRLRVGTKFNCHEGRKIVARGTVTRLRKITE